MKKVLALTALAVTSTSAFAGSSYVTGNVQFHSTYLQGAKQTSTLEAGHTFDSNTTLLVEIDAIPLGDVRDGDRPLPFTTLGAEQVFNINDNFWVAAGYHHLIQAGDTFQYRPLIKIGYNFDNGISLSNRTRHHIQADDKRNDETRLDNKIAYAFQDQPLAVSYNNIYVIKQGGADNSMDHELRATWTRSGVQPYIEYRNQANNENNALVFGASYGF
ncbi:oligogalacturonate-specific porin KdgM family protein [Vibrio variabilis]|uniref:oligogalacturonate-specific porin KdgM family protein n=1 Tax=Vibrio variabilis TaxID=990271 RepID=UPI000DD7CA61|nr:oligogalacturonate-specific porin KdgM family protein [Vibrio variabilis]